MREPFTRRLLSRHRALPLKPQRAPLLHLRAELSALFRCHLLQTFAPCCAYFGIELRLALLKRTNFSLDGRSCGTWRRCLGCRNNRPLPLDDPCLARLNTLVDHLFSHKTIPPRRAGERHAIKRIERIERIERTGARDGRVDPRHHQRLPPRESTLLKLFANALADRSGSDRMFGSKCQPPLAARLSQRHAFTGKQGPRQQHSRRRVDDNSG